VSGSARDRRRLERACRGTSATVLIELHYSRDLIGAFAVEPSVDGAAIAVQSHRSRDTELLVRAALRSPSRGSSSPAES